LAASHRPSRFPSQAFAREQFCDIGPGAQFRMECQEQIAVQPHERSHALPQTLFPLLGGKLFRCSLQADIERLFHGSAPEFAALIDVPVAAVFAVGPAVHNDAVAAAIRSPDL
jgi:hypothetical protein